MVSEIDFLSTAIGATRTMSAPPMQTGLSHRVLMATYPLLCVASEDSLGLVASRRAKHQN